VPSTLPLSPILLQWFDRLLGVAESSNIQPNYSPSPSFLHAPTKTLPPLSFCVLSNLSGKNPPLLLYASLTPSHIQQKSSDFFLSSTPLPHPTVFLFCSPPRFSIKTPPPFPFSAHQCSSIPLHHSRRLHPCTPSHTKCPMHNHAAVMEKTSAAKNQDD